MVLGGVRKAGARCTLSVRHKLYCEPVAASIPNVITSVTPHWAGALKVCSASIAWLVLNT